MKQKNKSSFDPLAVATIFASIGNVIKCCGPKYLKEQTAKILATFLALPNSENEKEENTFSILDYEILRPFAHQAFGEMFQRGTISEREDEKKNLEQFPWSVEKFVNSSSSSSSSVSSSSSPAVVRQRNEEEKEQEENSTNIPTSLLIIVTPIANFFGKNDELIRDVSQEDIELWIRSLSALLSSSIGFFAFKKVVASAERLEKLESRFSSVAKQMIKSAASTGTIDKKVIALNAIQSVAVPLSFDLRSIITLNNNKSIIATTAEEILQQSSYLLNKLLHDDLLPPTSTDKNNNTSSFFPTTLFPLSRNLSSTSTAADTARLEIENKVPEAFWTMIEQLVVLPPFVELLRSTSSSSSNEIEEKIVSKSINNNENDSTTTSTTTNLQDIFVSRFVEPVLSPMMPSLVSLLSSVTSQKELGADLYQKRRNLASALLRVEQIVVSSNNNKNKKAAGLVCGCSGVMWNRLKNSVLILTGGIVSE